VVAPAATVTDAGTVTAALLLARVTARPPVAAAAFRVTVQASIAAPATELLVHVTAVGTGVPVPLRAIVSIGFEDAWVVTVRLPVTAPVAVGATRDTEARIVRRVAQVRADQAAREGIAELPRFHGKMTAERNSCQIVRMGINTGRTTVATSGFFSVSAFMLVVSLLHGTQSAHTEG